jgi:hypothetical protein
VFRFQKARDNPAGFVEMKFMRITTPLLVALLFALNTFADDLNQLSPAEKAQGWKLLFNGTDLAGWRPYGKSEKPGAGWKVEQGILKKLADVPAGDLITESLYNDFELSWEWRITTNGNNGVKYLVTEKRPSAPGQEYQMLDDTSPTNQKLAPRFLTASFYEVFPASEKKRLQPVGEWNSSRILVRGNHVEHWLNGAKVLEYELGSPEVKEAVQRSKFKNAEGFGEKIKGHIMLTDHHDECWFRNIKLREF